MNITKRDELNETVESFMLFVATSKKILKEDEQNTPYHQDHDTLPFCSSRFSYRNAYNRRI